jgi:hypothetical protein
MGEISMQNCGHRTEENRPLGRSRNKWEGNITMEDTMKMYPVLN